MDAEIHRLLHILAHPETGFVTGDGWCPWCRGSIDGGDHDETCPVMCARRVLELDAGGEDWMPDSIGLMPESMAYIVRRPCGCIAAAIQDDPAATEYTAATVARWIRDGRAVEHVTSDEVRRSSWECPVCCPKQLALGGEG